MSSFRYYERLIRTNPTGARTAYIDGISAVLHSYWRLAGTGKLPPLSVDDRDEALDRVMSLLAPTLAKYDPERGATIRTFVGRVMQFAWLRYAHQVARESSALQTNVFDQDSAQTDDMLLDPYREDTGAAPGDELTYASPPLGFADPQQEAENSEHIEILAAVASGAMTGGEYRRRSASTKVQADSRRRHLQGRRRRRRRAAA